MTGRRKDEKKVWQHRELGVAHEIRLGLLLGESECLEVSHDEAASIAGDWLDRGGDFWIQWILYPHKNVNVFSQQRRVRCIFLTKTCGISYTSRPIT